MTVSRAISMDNDSYMHRVSLVIPVYLGEKTLPALMQEIVPLTNEQETPNGNRYVVSEVLLVHDCGPDRSDITIESLSGNYSFMRPVWLSRNYGQHPATLAGMASATGDWVATIDEDGQQDPADIGGMLDCALAGSLQVVYAHSINPPPHGLVRNMLSGTVKLATAWWLGNREFGYFNSFRLVDGEIARTLAAYCGNGVYLDVALFWITGRVGHYAVRLRSEMNRRGRRSSGYSYRKLLSHFWRLVLTTGTGPLRFIALVGFGSMALAAAIAGYALYAKFSNQVPVEGWTSLVIVVAFFGGAILTALGVIAEYLAVSLGIAMGKPLYVVGTKPVRPADHR